MTQVHTAMTTDLVVVSPGLSLRDLADLLAAEDISGVPVVAGGRVVGVVTLDDLAGFLASQPLVPRERSIDLDWETDPPGEWTEGEDPPGSYFSAWWSDAGADAVERLRAESSPEWDLLGEHTVADAMSRRIISVTPEDDLTSAARRMHAADVHRLLVMDDGTLYGLLTSSDVVRAVAEGRV